MIYVRYYIVKFQHFNFCSAHTNQSVSVPNECDNEEDDSKKVGK